MQILDYVYYRRTGDHGNPYIIACLVARFEKASRHTDYIAPAIFALAPDNRRLIADVARETAEGKTLLADLAEVVQLRNAQARKTNCQELPPP
jgi:hypothetical protein